MEIDRMEGGFLTKLTEQNWKLSGWYWKIVKIKGLIGQRRTRHKREGDSHLDENFWEYLIQPKFPPLSLKFLSLSLSCSPILLGSFSQIPSVTKKKKKKHRRKLKTFFGICEIPASSWWVSSKLLFPDEDFSCLFYFCSDSELLFQLRFFFRGNTFRFIA